MAVTSQKVTSGTVTSGTVTSGTVTSGTVPSAPTVSLIVPTLGHSPQLAAALVSLHKASRARPGDSEILLVVPSGLDPSTIPCLAAEPAALAAVDRVVETPRGGFSAANNVAFEASDGELVATVNDDAVVDETWLRELVDAMADPRLGAAQGVQRRFFEPHLLDGFGIGWNRWWQAVQLGHLRPLGEAPDTAAEIFGVSATAAIYRRRAVLDAHSPNIVGPFFDETLFAYYEDVDLAARLQAAGCRAVCLPTAGAAHVGSLSGRRLPFGGRQLIHANRHLVLARLLGRAFWAQWPRILCRDLIDGLRLAARGDLAGVGGLTAAKLRILRHLPQFAHLGEAAVDLRHWTESDHSAYYGLLKSGPPTTAP